MDSTIARLLLWTRHHAIRMPIVLMSKLLRALGRQLAMPSLLKQTTGYDDPTVLDRLRISNLAVRTAKDLESAPTASYAPVLAETAFLLGVDPSEIAFHFRRYPGKRERVTQPVYAEGNGKRAAAI